MKTVCREEAVPLRILHVTGGMNIGGAETMLMHLYKSIDRSRVQFDFVSFSEDKCYYDDQIKVLGGRVLYAAPPQKTSSLSFVRDLISIIKYNGPYHAVHAHTLFNSGLALLAARLAGVKLRICHSHSTLDSRYFLWTRKAYFIIMKALIKLNANKSAACSKAAGRFLFGEKAINKQELTILNNAIDLAPYKSIGAEEVKSLRKKLGIAQDTLVIGHVGRFVKEKNHIFLIRLAELLKSKGVDFTLVLLGEGSLKQQIISVAEERGLNGYVRFLGIQPKVPLYMHMFDVFVFPSHYEGLGMVLIEAQAAGTPCVISSTVPDECDMGLGLITRLDLDEKMENWISAVLQNRKVKGIPAETTTSTIMEKGYNLDATVKTLLNMYELIA